jgi:hypothetical protein
MAVIEKGKHKKFPSWTDNHGKMIAFFIYKIGYKAVENTYTMALSRKRL